MLGANSAGDIVSNEYVSFLQNKAAVLTHSRCRGRSSLSSYLSQTRPRGFRLSRTSVWVKCSRRMIVSVSFDITTKRWQSCWTAQMACGTILSSAPFNHFAGFGIKSVDSVPWKEAGTCSWFTTMTLNTTGTTERLTNHYFPNKFQQLILFSLMILNISRSALWTPPG